MSDKYYRLVTFIVDICTLCLRELFIQKARNDTATTFTSMQAYMHSRKPSIDQLKPKSIKHHQYIKIFPATGFCDEATWDITLLSALILNMFKVETKHVRPDIEAIRDIRNNMQHITGTARVSDQDFDHIWVRLEKATVCIALDAKGPIFQNKIQGQINNIKVNDIPGLVDTVRLWYTSHSDDQARIIRELHDTVFQLNKTIENQGTTIKNLESNVSALTKTVENDVKKPIGKMKGATVKRKNRQGSLDKRMRVDNEKCNRMRKKLASAMKKVPEDFVPPSELSNIKDKLNTDRHVLVTGSNVHDCLQTALYAIRATSHDITRCVMMNVPNQWSDIDPQEDGVDLVVLINPFTEQECDENEKRALETIFDEILDEVEDGLKLIIVIKKENLDRVIEQTFSHNLLKDRILIYQPGDINFQKSFETALPKVTKSYMSAKELLDMRHTIRTQACIVVTGNYNSSYLLQSTMLAVKDMGFDPEHSALISDASYWKHLQLDDINLVIISDPFGTTVFNDEKSRSMVDTIGDILANTGDSKRDLKVIIVSPKEVLNAAVHAGCNEAILDNCIMLCEPDTAVEDGKDEHKYMTSSFTSQTVANMYKMTSVCMETMQHEHCDGNGVKSALERMKENKVVVLTGPSTVRAATAVAIAKTFDQSKCVILTNPDHFIHVPLDEISLLVIQDVTGLCRYNEHHAHKWFMTFDTLHSLVKEDKIHVVITTDTDKLNLCIEDYGEHEIFKHTIEVVENLHLEAETMQVDGAIQGIKSDTLTAGAEGSVESIEDIPGTSAPSIHASLLTTIDTRADTENETDVYDDQYGGLYGHTLTIVNEKYIVVVYIQRHLLKCIDRKQEKVVSKLYMLANPYEITTISDDEVAMTFCDCERIQFVSVSRTGQLRYKREIEMDYGCTGIIHNNGILAVGTEHTIQFMNMSGTFINSFETGKLYGDIRSLTLSHDKKHMYITNIRDTSITVMTMSGEIIEQIKDEENMSFPMCVAVDAVGNIYARNLTGESVVYVYKHEGKTVFRELVGVVGTRYNRGSIAFCVRERKLYVREGPKINVYQISYASKK